VYLTPAARALLDDGRAHNPDEPCFPASHGGCYTPAGLRAILRRRGLTGAYQLRHTFAQQALDTPGVRMEDVAKLLGHADLRMVQVYAQVRDRRARQVAETINFAFLG